MLTKINIARKLALHSDHWVPRIVGELNGQYVKVVKFKGAYDWHFHANEDELFWVIRGSFRLELCDGAVEVGPGEFVIVPRGTEHRPVAAEECEVVLFEPAATLNTGNVRTGHTLEQLERI